jgi:hypothetical protein
VDRVTKEGGPDFISQEKRIATFDNDSTLWVEAPIYIRSCKAEGPQHDGRRSSPSKRILEGDMKTLAATDEKGLCQVIVATSTGMTNEQFEQTVSEWIAQAHDRKFSHPYIPN